jgi:hypothetical protein
MLKAGGVVHPSKLVCRRQRWQCGLLGGTVVWSLRWRCWALGPSLDGGLALDSKLVCRRQRWRCVWAVLQGGRTSRSPAGFSMVALVIGVSRVVMEVSRARRRCLWWRCCLFPISDVRLVVLCVGIIHRSQIVLSVLVSVINLGCSH